MKILIAIIIINILAIPCIWAMATIRDKMEQRHMEELKGEQYSN
jgi:hypothetical protein